MVKILKNALEHASAWHGRDLSPQDSWLYRLTSCEIDELHAAVTNALAKQISATDLRSQDFPLQRLTETLSNLRDEIECGRGFVVIRGVPTGEYSVEENKILYAGIISHLGEMIYQDVNGCLIDEVINRGESYQKIEVRGYQTNACLTPHCDSGDIVGLQCIRPAKQGGTSNVSSFVTVYNEILTHHPEYLPCLYRGFHYNIRGGGPPGPFQDITRHRVPVFAYYDGRLSGRFNAKAIRTAQQLPGVEPLTDLEEAAIDCVADMAMRDDLRLDMNLEAGDLQLLCNHTVMHNRTAFVDDDHPRRKRLLLRAWINIPNGRALPLEFDDHYNTGPRQGTYVQQELVTK